MISGVLSLNIFFINSGIFFIKVKYRNIVVGVFFKGVEVFGIILLRFDEIEFIYLKLMFENIVKCFIVFIVKMLS